MYYILLTTKSLVSICYHTIDPYIYFAFPPPRPFSSGNHQAVVCLYVFAFVLFSHYTVCE